MFSEGVGVGGGAFEISILVVRVILSSRKRLQKRLLYALIDIYSLNNFVF